MKKSIYYVWLSIFLTACAAHHNVPDSQVPNNFIKPNTISAFVDQNGNFYPNQWKTTYGDPPKSAKRDAYSLMKIATEKGIEKQLTTFESRHLNQVGNKLLNKERVFIFVHGINSDYMSSLKNYNYAKNMINVSNTNDQVINFYWDGLVAESLFGGAKVWVQATTFSQTAGEFGLRRVLNTMHKKQVFIISHSRGASVVLSALSTPTYKKSLVERTYKKHNVDIDRLNELKENNNEIICIMLAPAVGLEDFKSKTEMDSIETFNTFTPQLKRMHITTNETDRTLAKFFGFLSKKLKPTDLGYKADAYNELINYYPFLEKTDFTGMESHEFRRYLRNPKFKDVLKEYKLAK